MTKLIKLYLLFTLFFVAQLLAQEIPVNKYGLKVVTTVEQYQKLAEQNPNKTLVDLTKAIPGIVLDIRYATADNITKKPLYTVPGAFLRAPAARSLKKVQDSLATLGLGIKIFDAYRPYSVTEKLWLAVLDDRYAAEPRKGSRHNRGCAVDLTLVNLSTGEELKMPTGFDDFTVKAHHSYMNLPRQVIKNRALLKSLMELNGFESITSEWWHYDFKGYSAYEIMDISYEQLLQLK